MAAEEDLDGLLFQRWLRCRQAIPNRATAWDRFGGDAARLDRSLYEENLRRLQIEREEIVRPGGDCAPKVALPG